MQNSNPLAGKIVYMFPEIPRIAPFVYLYVILAEMLIFGYCLLRFTTDLNTRLALYSNAEVREAVFLIQRHAVLLAGAGPMAGVCPV